MKTIIFIFCLFSIACVTSGLNPRAVTGAVRICTKEDAAQVVKRFYNAVRIVDVYYDHQIDEFKVIFLNNKGEVETKGIPFACNSLT